MLSIKLTFLTLILSERCSDMCTHTPTHTKKGVEDHLSSPMVLIWENGTTADICCFHYGCCVWLLKFHKLQKIIFVTHLLINPSCQGWMIYEWCYSWCHSPLLLPLRFYSLVWIITVTNSSCSPMAFWIEREGESASEREAAIERREAWEINSSELTLRGPGTAEYCSSGGELEGGPEGKKIPMQPEKWTWWSQRGGGRITIPCSWQSKLDWPALCQH